MAVSGARLPIDAIGQLRDDFSLSKLVLLLCLRVMWVSSDYLEHCVAFLLVDSVMEPTPLWRGGDAPDAGGSIIDSAASCVS